MAGRNDLAGLIRGLDLIRRALVESQGNELRHMWDNSSLKSAAEGMGTKVQENISKGGQVTDLPVRNYELTSLQLYEEIYQPFTKAKMKYISGSCFMPKTFRVGR